MSAKGLPSDLPTFEECENEAVEFKSTLSLER